MQETLYIGQWCLSCLQSRHTGDSHSSPNHHQLPHNIFLNLIDGLKSLPGQRWFKFWEQPEVTGHQIWVVEGPSHLDDLVFCQKLCMRCDAWLGTLLWWSCQSPVAIAVAFWIPQIVSMEEFSSLMHNLMHIRCLTHSVIFNVMATQCTCSLSDVYCSRCLVQWSHHCLHTGIPVHSHWLPGYTDVVQSILTTLTMVGLFPDRLPTTSSQRS